MDVGESLRAFLAADGTVASLLTSADGTVRIYPDELPQGPIYPAVRYTLVGELDHYHAKGPSNLTRMRWQIDCYAPRKRDANTVARAVRDRLRGYKGPMGSHVTQGIFVESTRSDRVREVEPPVAFVSRDFRIWVED